MSRKNETYFENIQISKICYDKDFNVCEEKDCVCKIVSDNETKQLIYLVKKDKDTGWLLDIKEEKYTDEFIRTSWVVYELYANYLKTKKDIYLIKARKEMIQ